MKRESVGRTWRALGANVALASLLLGTSSVALAAPGEDTEGVGISQVQFGSLAPIVLESGRVSWSIDGLGTLANTGTIQVEKPAGATVRRAFIAAASTGVSGYKMNNTELTVDGQPVAWTVTTLSSISSWNHWAEVTNLVKAKIDAAPAGMVDIRIVEANSSRVDGEVLAVIFDDPNQTSVNTVALMFGAQAVGGDTFSIQLSDPVNLSNPDFSLAFSLGSSFSFQTNRTQQYSIVDVNGRRLSTSAGGEDDGQAGNGALLTVGGIGDTTVNPAPNATPTAPRSDDELYDLVPFTQNGDTSLTVFSRNPSNDDNIFFAGLFVGGAAAIVGEGIVLGPLNASLTVGNTTSIVATVQDANGRPMANRPVTFTVTAGPNRGVTGVVSTDASGKATFTYVGSGGVGVDELQATFVDSTNLTETSNVALRFWTALTLPTCALTDVIVGPPKQLEITVQAPAAGLHAIEIVEAQNSTVDIPLFPQGDKTPVVVLASKTDETVGSLVALRVTDLDGQVTVCDPLVPADTVGPAEAPASSTGPEAGCSMGAPSSSGALSSLLLSALVGLFVRKRRRSA